MTNTRSIIFAAIAAVLVLAAGYFGMTKAWGAHPFWSFKVAWIGVLPGLVLWFVFRRFGMKALIGAALLVLLTWLAASNGKSIFAASYAENALAGRFWFFGWIGLCAATTWFITQLLEISGKSRK